jgi:glycosyltransferase involved in cell wall biosynthesis
MPKSITLALPRALLQIRFDKVRNTGYGRPVVSQPSEKSGYRSVGENAYIAEPGNVTSFASKMKYVLDNYDEAIKAGRKGRDLAFSVFNYNIQAKRIIQLIGSLS